ncbi:MAG: response regulator transcription factor [Acidimicrobiia bacterium]
MPVGDCADHLKVKTAGADALSMTPGKILLIEDEPSNSRLMEVTLRPLGYETIVRVDGFAGLEAARDEPIELIVLDLALPKMDGWQVLERLRSDPHTVGIPVLVMTAHVGDENLTKAADAGADVFMTKPFQPEDLRQVARALIRQRRESVAQRNGNPNA